jgi:hypothetical protein
MPYRVAYAGHGAQDHGGKDQHTVVVDWIAAALLVALIIAVSVAGIIAVARTGALGCLGE